MENTPAQPMGQPGAVKPSPKPNGPDRFRSVMPIALMAFAMVGLLLLIFLAVT